MQFLLGARIAADEIDHVIEAFTAVLRETRGAVPFASCQ